MRNLFKLFNYGSRRVRCRFFGGIESRFLGQTRRVNSKFKKCLDFKRIGVVTSLGFSMVYTAKDPREQKQILKNAKRVSIEEAKRILELDGLNLNERHELGWTCLHVQVASNNISVVKLMLTLGADPNISYEFRNTGNGSTGEKPPHEMLCQDNKFCESLVNVINFKGFTSLHFAVLIGNLEMVTILLEAGADPLKKSEQGFTPSCLTNDPEILKLLEKYQKINEIEDKENDNADEKQISEKVSDSKETGNEFEHEINDSDYQNKDQMREQSLEVPVLKNETMDIQSEQIEKKQNDFPSQDKQTSDELNVISVQEQKTTELDEVQKQSINGKEVSQEPEGQKQKIDYCEGSETPKMEAVNEPYEGEKIEPLSEEITEDVQRQEVKQEQNANESQVQDFTNEQENLVSRKHDYAMKTELANDETFSDKSETCQTETIKTEQVEKQGEEASVKLVETIELEVKEEKILEGLTLENGIQSVEHTLNIVEEAQLFDELKVILVQDQRASELAKVELLINDKDVTQETEDQKQNCEQAETPKMETENETSEEDKMELLYEEITEIKGDVPTKESQVHDFTEKQGNLLSGKHDGEVKTELASKEIKSVQVEKQGEEASIKLVEIVEKQMPKENVIEEELIFDGKLKVNEGAQEIEKIKQELESKANLDCRETEIFDVILKADKLEIEPIKQELNTDCHEEAIKIKTEDMLKIESGENLTPETQSSTASVIFKALVLAALIIVNSII